MFKIRIKTKFHSSILSEGFNSLCWFSLILVYNAISIYVWRESPMRRRKRAGLGASK